MSFFDWDQAKFGLGVPEMDREHQTLIGYMNALHALHAAKAPRAELGRALDQLAKFTVRHFADEEAYMERIGYPGLARHKLTHQDLLNRVGTYVGEFQASGQLTDAFFAFLKMWLKAHICGIDAKYSPRAAAA